MDIVSSLAKQLLEAACGVCAEQCLCYIYSELKRSLGYFSAWIDYIHAWDVNQA
jgi:hypothetical protein